jgi:hypothetical protein
MSRHPDPCYCEQAQEYEALLEKIKKFWKGIDDLPLPEKQLLEELEQTVGEYKQAQEEYRNE